MLIISSGEVSVALGVLRGHLEIQGRSLKTDTRWSCDPTAWNLSSGARDKGFKDAPCSFVSESPAGRTP